MLHAKILTKLLPEDEHVRRFAYITATRSLMCDHTDNMLLCIDYLTSKWTYGRWSYPDINPSLYQRLVQERYEIPIAACIR